MLLLLSWSLPFKFLANALCISYPSVRVTCSANLTPFDLITDVLRQMTKPIVKELVIRSYSFQYL